MEDCKATMLFIKEGDPFIFGLLFASGMLVALTVSIFFTILWVAFLGLFV